MFDVTKISCAPRDVLIFSVDMDLYDIEECRGIYEAILQQAPDMKIIFVPDDLVKEIIQVNRTIPMYYNNNDLITTTTHSTPTTGYIHSNPTTRTVDGVSIEDTQW